MQISAPTVADMIRNELVIQALEGAWSDSFPSDETKRHEEGGWLFMDITTGALLVSRSPSGNRASIDLTVPPIINGAVVVATFHTHPNPSDDEWEPGPSDADERNALHFGVPFLIRADDGVHWAGPNSRRGGLSGAPGFPF